MQYNYDCLVLIGKLLYLSLGGGHLHIGVLDNHPVRVITYETVTVV